MTTASQEKPRIVFIANCVYGDHVAGGDIHFFHMAQAAIEAGYHVHFFGGHALKAHLARRGIAATQTLTDRKPASAINSESFWGGMRLLLDYAGRYCRTLFKLSEIHRDDTVYAVTDYWFDVWPVLACQASKKMMVFHMDAPTLREIIFRSRSDVSANRINSIYYWLSQTFSLWMFRRLENKKVLYVHPDMRPRLRRLGFRDSELTLVSSGMNWRCIEKIPIQEIIFDAIWLGRVHRQKGIDDLLATLVMLRKEVDNFRAVLVGNLEALTPRLAELNLSGCVSLSGLVSEEEKFRLFKASRVFLMPSRQESWGIVIAEALACDVPVVAYDLPAYRPIFGGLVDYVTPFDFETYKMKSLEAVQKARRGENNWNLVALALFKTEYSLQAAGKRFVTAVRNF